MLAWIVGAPPPELMSANTNTSPASAGTEFGMVYVAGTTVSLKLDAPSWVNGMGTQVVVLGQEHC